MSLKQNSKVLPGEISDKMVAAMIANALREEHADTTAAVKRIARLTNANLHSVAKWYQGQNAPKSAHLLMLARTYPSILRMILQIVGRGELSEVLDITSNAPDAVLSNHKDHAIEAIYRVKFVPINVVIDSQIAIKLNQRQLWMLGELQQGNIINSVNIEAIWQVSSKTAKRDISGLYNAGLIEFIGAKKNGHYSLK